MRSAFAAAIALALASACSGGGGGATEANRFVPTSRGASKQSPSSSVVLPAHLKPPAPARMFAGTASVVGQLLHYCQDSSCADLPSGSLTYLSVGGGAIVLFALGQAPLEAVAEIRTRPSEKPATVHLDPGDLMVFDHGLGSGRFLVDLVCRWRTSEARWRFGVDVA